MKKIKINDLSTSIFSGGTPSTHIRDYWIGENNWLSSGETKNPLIKQTEKRISDKAVKESSTKLSIPEDILIASAGQGQTRGQVSFNCINTYINQSIICIRCNKEIISPKYLYYNLSNKYIELRQLSDSNSIRGSLTTKLIGNFEIYVHKYNQQQHIVNTIGSIDDLIEKTNKINEKIIKLSLKLFDLIIKKNEYETSSLKDELSLLKDGTHNPPKRINNGVPLLTGINIEKGFINYKDITYISYKDYLKIHSKYCPKENDLLITKIGTLGKVAIIRKTDLPIAIHCNSALMRFKNVAFSTAYFILCSNDFKNEFHSHKNQTVQEFINLEQISNLTIKIPDKKYDSTFEQMLLLISNNNYKLKYFEILKSTLLNKFFK